MNFLFRRSASIAAASASKRTLAALLSSEPLRLPPAIPSESFASAPSIPARKFHGSKALEELGFGGLRRRDLHSSSVPLGFRATDAVRVEYAVDEFYDEEKSPAAKKVDEGLEIAKLGIAQEIVSNLAKKGITKLFPIQKAVLEPAMQGRDMTGRAKTGTGKTLAFGIPIMDKILRFNAKHGRGRNPLAIVLAPTRELARQVEKEFRETAPLDTVCIYGGSPIQQQMRTLDYGVDVVVGTPGRIIDLLKRGALNLSEVQFVVLDEADQMLAVGFDEDVEIILEKLPRKRQSMMFSATMPPWIRKLTQKYLNDPLIIDLVGENDQKLAEGITLYSIATDNYGKSSIIGPLIKEHAKGGKCIVFTQTKRDADRLSYAMSRSFGCQPLHGDISQNLRERTLAGFRDGHFNILVATDVAARGLDIPNVDLIVHYELPNSSELFVHRSGRTGRAGKKGCAILIYTREQTRLVRGIEQDIGCKFTELPTIAVDGGGEDMFGDMGNRFGSSGGGRMNGPGFGRGGGGGGYGGSNYGRPRGYGGSGGAGGFGGRTGGYGESGSGRFGSSSGSGFGGSGFGRSGDSGSGRSGGFGSFGDSGSGRSGGFGSFGDSGSGRSGSFGSFGDSGSGRFGSFGDSGSRRSNSFGGSRSSSSGSFGGSSLGGFGGASDKSNREDGWPGRSFMSSS